MTIRRLWHFLWETLRQLLPDAVRSMALYREPQWVNSIRRKRRLTGLVAGGSMIILLLCCTGFIGYLPIPVLTAIVISALLGATEFELVPRLWKVSRTECFIFLGAFFGVLFLGTINGVLIGIILSFTEMIIRTAKPATCFLGIQPGQ